MSKHAADRRPSRERAGALAATVGAVCTLGLVIAILVGLHAADGDPADPVADEAANTAARALPSAHGTPRSTASGAAAAASSADEPQVVVQARTLKLDMAQVIRARAERRASREAARKAKLPKTSSFRIGTLNILGSQHTAGRGGYGPGPERAAITAGLVRSRGIQVAGFQEVQDDQIPALQNNLPGYAMWPVQALGSNGQRLQVAWLDSKFELVDTGSVSYVFASQSIPLPWVRLRDREHGGEFYVITAHNSAGGMETQRDAATTVEIALVKQLRSTGLPVIITGDMNEHEEFFCRAATEADMVAANGGSGAGGCQLPPNPRRVDWIMGTSDVAFSGYVQDGASRAAASDHYLLYADVGLDNPAPAAH
ncbi:endonuclease/exonuclease/phosphatase family protein [Nocardioides conyzicola]|uniref:Endonuclease/exonuclease/phosphatase domain-containing protein n=1 Tax=Nocardioides conyzicola TaxID=1651781 RepID=A0ABP8WVA0_9ACTN